MLVSYNWLKEYIGENTPTPEQIAELLTKRAFEVEEMKQVGDDVMMDIDVLPNRSSDCLSHRGIAKEIAVIFGIELENDPFGEKVELKRTDEIAVNIENETDCPRFTASLISGIEVKESPQWLKDRLETIGQRSINTIVDATNYVMYATGQPLHAYDATKFPQVDGKWQFGVRRAKEGEVVSLLAEGGRDEDRDVELKGTELLIVDESSNTPIGLAGVKGGRFAGVDEKTSSIIVEAAHFDAGLTRQTARRLGIVIDASKRFENEPSRELPHYAQSEIISLIKDIAGGEFEGWMDVYPSPIEQPEVSIRPEKVNALLGLDLSREEMMGIVRLLGATVTETDDGFTATSPFERTDLHIEEDYIEEIGRVYGVEHVESVVPDPVPLAEINKRQYYSEVIRGVLMEAGFNEVITSSFRKKDQLRLANALASDKGYMRSSLQKNIDTVLDNNVSNLDVIGAQDVRVFEIGTVFSYDEKKRQISEHTSLAVGVRTKHSGYTPKDDAKVDTAIEAINSILELDLPTPVNANLSGVTKKGIDFMYEKGVFEFNFSKAIEVLPEPAAYEAFPGSAEVTYVPFSQYPAMSRDIAMWVKEEVTAEQVETVLNAHAGDLRVRTTLFDEFSKDGKTSLAFRLVFQSNEKTLTDSEVNIIMDDVYAAVAKEGWEVR